MMFKKIVPIIACVLALLLAVLGGTAAPADQGKRLLRDRRVAFTGDLPGMMKRTVVRVGTTYSRTNFFFVKGHKHGFEYSLLRDYQKELNRRRKRGSLPVSMIFFPLPHDRLIPALLKGKVDLVAAGLTITPQRMKLVDFTEPYLTGVDEVLVTSNEAQVPAGLEGLAGKKIYVRKSSSYYTSLQALNRRLRKKGLAPVKIIPADPTLATEDILEMVNAGIVDYTIADSHLARLWAQMLPAIKVHYKLKVRTGGKLAWMVRKNNPKLKASLNRFIRRHRRGTLKGNIYFNRYFKKTRWVKNPISPQAKARLNKYRRLFKKYGQRYRVDWMLLAAQAFRESGLNPKARSHAGAIGIMQLRPSLGKDPRIAIKNLQQTENNIHAGAKYLALLRDQYYSSPKITPTDQLRFALAAYNAGPARMARIRRLASRMKLDPNRWFKNVEVAALKVVGRETVRYVRDINIIYVAYKLAFAQSQKKPYPNISAGGGPKPPLGSAQPH